MKAFPEEIETILNTHPEVARSRVIGRDHPQMGQIPVAEIIPSDPDSPPKPLALQKHCRIHLSAYKVPLRFTFVETLLLTASGKIKRTLLPRPGACRNRGGSPRHIQLFKNESISPKKSPSSSSLTSAPMMSS